MKIKGALCTDLRFATTTKAALAGKFIHVELSLKVKEQKKGPMNG